MRLSGSYDHGSSLGFSLRGATCARMLTAPDGVETWCRRGRAIRIDGQPGLVVAAQRALDLATPPARAYWIAQLGHVESDQVRSVIDRMPRMSEDQRAFVTRLLEINRGRLLHACA